MRLAAVWILASAAACGGAAGPIPQQVVVTSSESPPSLVQDAAVAHQKAPEPERDPGPTEPLAVAGFVRFVALEHGATETQVQTLLPEQAPGLGQRNPADMAGSTGVRYAGHLEVAWDPDTLKLQYIGVKSAAAVDYLEAAGHGDPRIRSLWGRDAGAVRAMLGAPTEQFDRPHAVTWRYEFTAADGRRGALSLELTKLGERPTVSGVSVHWK